jgi:hypothetical protein
MNILKYFDAGKQGDFNIYRFKSEEFENILKDIVPEFRQCYITDEELDEKATKKGMSKSDFLEKYILPDVGNIKSGDFGEMLSYCFLLEHYESKGVILVAPKKWLWKERNKPTPYSDVIAFHLNEKGKPTNNDLLISVESKMKATKSGEHRIQDTIDGANKDKLSRLAKTLEWLDETYTRRGIADNDNIIQRFKDPSQYGSYTKIYKAFAIIDKNSESDELATKVINNEGIIVIVISIEKLKDMYEENRLRMICSVKQ